MCQTDMDCIQIFGSGTSPIFIENLVLDGTLGSSFLRAWSQNGASRSTSVGAPLLFRGVTFRNLFSTKPAIVSESSAMTFQHCDFVNMSVKALVHSLYNDNFKWQDGSVLSICSPSNVYVPLVFHHTTLIKTDGWDILWGENKRPVVARVNQTSLVCVVQTSDLSSRDPFEDSTACSISLYPNCLSKVRINRFVQDTNYRWHPLHERCLEYFHGNPNQHPSHP